MKLNPSETYATYIINDKLIEILGLPKKSKGVKKNYQGHFPLIFKWLYKDKHDIKYIWYVVNRIHVWWKQSGINITIGYFNTSFKTNKEGYELQKMYIHLPYSASREDMLAHGHTVESLPFHLLTTKERKQREEDVPVENVTEEDREAFREFLRKI